MWPPLHNSIAEGRRQAHTMELSLPSLLALPFALLFISASSITAQETNTNTTDFSCTPGSPSSCNAYVVYRAQSPEFLDMVNISGLFNVTPQSIWKVNNLSSEEAELIPGQLLLVPVLCGCTGNRSFANISYEIKKDDSFFIVSTAAFGRLTDYLVVEELNPTMNPNNLTIGAKAVFPIYCKCPTRTQEDQGLNYVLTYVWQEDDTLGKLSSTMRSSSEDILSANNGRNFSTAVDKPVLIPVSNLPDLPRPSPLAATNTTNPRGKKRATQKAIVILSCTVGAALASAFWCFLFFMYRKCDRIRALVRTLPGAESSDLPQVVKPIKDKKSGPMKQDELLLTGVSDCLDKPEVYRTQAIMEGTANLDDRFRIGGAVFRASINGEAFAVKKAKGDVSEELKILQTVSHGNLVKLTGISKSSDGDFFLVYEYAENESLDKWLHPEVAPSLSSSSFLSWRQRLSIALDVANGLQYLHEHSSPSIVHGDIRATNILLDANFKAKISNFSKAKPVSASVTPKADAFAFGVLLLELLSGRKAKETGEEGEVSMSWREVRAVLGAEEGRGERLRRWMDPNLEGFYPIDGALSLANMARACTSENPSERPSTAEIAFGLSVLAQTCMESPWASNFCATIQITNPVFAR